MTTSPDPLEARLQRLFGRSMPASAASRMDARVGPAIERRAGAGSRTRRVSLRSALLAVAAFAILGGATAVIAVRYAAENPFPGPFEQASDWHVVSQLALRDPSPRATLGELVSDIEAFMWAGVKDDRPGSRVTVTVPDDAASAKEVHLFVTVLGGANGAESGWQMRLVVHHDQRGWWLDPTGESRMYCGQPLSGPSLQSCS